MIIWNLNFNIVSIRKISDLDERFIISPLENQVRATKAWTTKPLYLINAFF